MHHTSAPLALNEWTGGGRPRPGREFEASNGLKLAPQDPVPSLRMNDGSLAELELADVLAGVAEARWAARLASFSSGSQADQDRQLGVAHWQTAEPTDRVVTCGDVWTAVIADLLDAASLQLAAHKVSVALAPLVRSVVEHAGRTFWLLDPDGEWRDRAARAAAAELQSRHNDVAVVESFVSADSTDLDLARRQLDDARRRIESQFGPVSPRGLSVAGHSWGSSTGMIRIFGTHAEQGPDVWLGYYKWLSAVASHATMTTTSTIRPESGDLSIDRRTAEHLVRLAVTAGLDTFDLFAGYMQWPLRPLADARDVVATVLEGSP